MSLQFIIDGYNIIHHPIFTRSSNQKIKDQRIALLELIKREKLTGSFRNKITIVFDGYCNPEEFQGISSYDPRIKIIFSRKISADDRIKEMIEDSPNPKNIVVVSDDKEIRSLAKVSGAQSQAVEDFIQPPGQPRKPLEDLLKAELNFSQIHKINEELKKIWLNPNDKIQNPK